jgi:hypothetical protein
MAEGVRQMTPEKILELAHETVRLTWINDSPEDLIAFAQSVLEAEQKVTPIKVPPEVYNQLVKDVCTVKDLLIAMKAAEEEKCLLRYGQN